MIQKNRTKFSYLMVFDEMGQGHFGELILNREESAGGGGMHRAAFFYGLVIMCSPTNHLSCIADQIHLTILTCGSSIQLNN